MTVRAEAELIEIDRRRLVFSVKAWDEKELVGEGAHERFIINSENSSANAIPSSPEKKTRRAMRLHGGAGSKPGSRLNREPGFASWRFNCRNRE